MDHKAIYLARRNPAVTQQEWPRVWRSHPRFVSQFNQVRSAVHRLNYCARIYDPQSDSRSISLPMLSTDFDGVAVVASSDASLHELDSIPRDIHDAIMKDERRVFADITPNFTMRGREAMVVGGDPGPVALFHFIRRKPGMAQAEFLDRWSEVQGSRAEQAVSEGETVRYVHNAILLEPPPGYEFDGIAEIWFASLDHAVRSLRNAGIAAIPREVATICEPEKTVMLLTEVIYRIPRES